jgi:hypothetical protein
VELTKKMEGGGGQFGKCGEGRRQGGHRRGMRGNSEERGWVCSRG